ncbi:MAG: FAD-binding oxidoreductase [Planctomycetota bacterium]|nr:FAD-binding oxidoreductase [Planctomycetota bacterium]
MKLDRQVLVDLRNVFGNRLLTGELDLISYSYDGTGLVRMPDAVVRAKDEKEVAALLSLAHRHEFPVVPRGAATNLTGGAVPIHGGVVVDFTLMNRIIEIDTENLIAVVEPGVVVGDLQREAGRKKLFYPPDPASNEFSTIGGNIAEGAGGLRGLRVRRYA